MLFCIDQFIHFLIISCCSFYILFKDIFNVHILVILLAVLVLIKPVSIFITLFFKSIFKNEKDRHEIKNWQIHRIFRKVHNIFTVSF